MNDIERRRMAYAQNLCRRHAAPLFVLASALIGDAERASDIVAAAIAATCRGRWAESAAASETRARLTRSVYNRCLGHLVVVERFRQFDRPEDERFPRLAVAAGPESFAASPMG